MNGFTEGRDQTESLLACKRWWKVCFLHGDQQKYYRQIYSQAASQRVAVSLKQNDDNPSNRENEISQKTHALALPTLFPMKHSARRRHKVHSSSNDHQHCRNNSDIEKADKAINISTDLFFPDLKNYLNLWEESVIGSAIVDESKRQVFNSELWTIVNTNDFAFNGCSSIDSTMENDNDNKDGAVMNINCVPRFEKPAFYESLIDAINSR